LHTTVTQELDVTATEISTTLPTTLVTTVTVTQVAVPPSTTAFIIQASGSGTSYDGQYIYLPQGGNPFFQFTTDITSATPFDTTSASKFGGGTFPNVFQVASSVPRFAGLSAGGGNVNLASEQIYFYGPPADTCLVQQQVTAGSHCNARLLGHCSILERCLVKFTGVILPQQGI
jgi:hypothetical protein